VPREIHERIQEPLARRHSKAGKGGEWAAFFNAVTQIVADRNESTGQLIVYAILSDQVGLMEEARLTKFFGEKVLTLLCPDEDSWLDYESCSLIPGDQVLMTTVFDTYKLDLDYVSESRGGNQPIY
jgi:hypothetical protein